MAEPIVPSPSCPVPLRDQGRVLLAHGGGGRLMHELLESVFFAALRGSATAPAHDSSVHALPGGARIAFTTDSYVVHPRRFPGGDIGSLAVHGTVNDLAMSGARPLWLSAGFVLEEGLEIAELREHVQSMRDAAAAAGVAIVTGDTKVVERGKGDGLYVNTAGIGLVPDGVTIAPDRIRAGDAVLVSGDLGRHGIAILAVREGLAFETTIESDSAAVHGLVATLLDAGIRVHCLRDLTRGGLASASNELAAASGLAIELVEGSIPIAEPVRAACELLGLDPLYVACEGRFAAFVHPADAERAVALLRADPLGAGAAQIGHVAADGPARVTLHSRLGSTRVVDMLSGEQLPRIC
ncbi:MAG: hydrogenase expression/formation protein HypE [Planctomycetes bacterium]|nr:hydrogenase expression/formation protein HypE [Planctomycetota bacterium]